MSLICNYYLETQPNEVWLPGTPTFGRDEDGNYWVYAEDGMSRQLKDGDRIRVQIFSGSERSKDS